MPGLGDDPLGFGPLGGAVEPLSHARPSASVAWKIDPRTMRYVLADDGNVAGMDGTNQRVLLICVQTEKDNPTDIITPATRAALEQAYRLGLKPLVTERAISGLKVQVLDDGRETLTRLIEYKNEKTSVAMTYKNGVIAPST
jgi:hypothetical protein